MSAILITGANRALGYEWARQHAEAGWRVYATCRRPAEAEALQRLAQAHENVSVHRIDVTRPDEIQAVAAELREASIDLLVNNAGVYLEKYLPDEPFHLRYEDWEYTLRVNTLAQMRVTEEFIEHVARSDRRLVVAITSHMGSITELDAPGSYYYRSSKAALNAAMKGLSHALRPRGIGVLLLHPGWVRTRMGGPDARWSPAQSVDHMRRVVEEFDMSMTGRFFRYDGSEIPW
ncbi:MAG: SDR family oxidoreductase [Gammaproteobacteria bacterium]|nr:SDR family oxidoreductase [Gammaproteobacteria bacterium]